MKRILIILSIILVSVSTFAYDTTTWNRELEQAAKIGDPEAMFNLGCCYYNGNGVEQNYLKAVEWYLEAAELGHPKAIYNIGFLYYSGIGVPKVTQKL